MTKPISVAIIPGFGEGRIQSQKLRQALLTSGYRIASDPKTADIIIAHSAGCYLLPKQYRARAVFNIGYPLWPSRNILRSLQAKLADEYRRLGLVTWSRKIALNTLQALNVPHTWHCARGWRTREQSLQKRMAQQYFLRNKDDTYCHPDALRETAGENYVYISLPGYHDQLWDEPEPYVHLLQSVI